MSWGLLVPLLSAVLLLVLSALLSRCEAALITISRWWLGEEREKRKRNGFVRVLERRQELSLAILSARTVLNVAAISLVALIIARFFASRGMLFVVLLEVLVLGLLLLITVELLPKLIFLKRPVEVSSRLIRSMEILGVMFSPLVKILLKLLGEKTAVLVAEANLPVVADEELQVAIDAGEGPGLLEEKEREMIHSIFEFGETSVKEVMIPRIDMICADSNLSAQEALDLIVKSGHSRIPVFKDKIDHIIGLLYAKDLLGPLKKGQNDFQIRGLVRDVYFVPETKKIAELLREFQARRMHMAIVVDEYGGTAGLVTLEDLLEEIVGEIQDEYDTEEKLIKMVDERIAEVSAKMNLHDLNEELNLKLPDGEFDTLGGFIYDLAGAVPKRGATLEYQGMKFVVLEVRGQRVSKVKVVKAEDQEKVREKGG